MRDDNKITANLRRWLAMLSAGRSNGNTVRPSLPVSRPGAARGGEGPSGDGRQLFSGPAYLRFDNSDDSAEAYQPPRNAMRELYARMPDYLLPLMRAVAEEVEVLNPMGMWPGTPYHYGMGRIPAYEGWLNGLDEQDCARALTECRERYENYYQRSAELLIERMRAYGFDLVKISGEDRDADRGLQAAAAALLAQLEARRPGRSGPAGTAPALGAGSGN